MNVLWLVKDQATTSGSTVFIKLSFHFRWFKWTLNLINPLLWCEFLWWCPLHTFFLFVLYVFLFYVLLPFSLAPPPLFLFYFLFLFLLYLFSMLLVDFRQFQFNYFSEQHSVFFFHKFYGILSEKAFPSTCIHFYTKVGEKITGGWCLHSKRRFTRAHTQYSLTC